MSIWTESFPTIGSSMIAEAIADGFRADIDGNLWCGWGMGEAEDGVIVVSPAGKLIGQMGFPNAAQTSVLVA